MEKAFAKAEELAAAVREYADARISEVKLTTAEKTSKIIANLLAGAIVVLVFVFFIIMASITLGLLLGLWIGKMWIGFLIISCIYLLIGIVTWAARGKLIRLPIMNAMIQQLFKMEEDEED